MKIKIILSFIFITSNLSIAQFNTHIQLSAWYDNNLYRSPVEVEDVLTNINLMLNYEIPSPNITFSYDGDGYLYHKNSHRNFSSHDLGVQFTQALDNQKKHYFYAGTGWATRQNGEDYKAYNYSQFSGYANFRFHAWLFIKVGYNYRNRDYTNLQDLSNQRHWIFLQFNKSFPTRTTFILEGDYGYKSFVGRSIFTYETVIQQRGNGKGRGAQGNQTEMQVESEVEHNPELSQIVLLSRISQNLHEKAGIYIQFRRQFSLTDETSFINSDEFYQDEELFDDPFSYESKSLSSQFTWLLPGGIQLQTGASKADKEYVSENAFVSATDSLASGGIRKDNRESIYLNISKSLNVNRPWIKSLLFRLNYHYIHNRSNSYWYDYNNTLFGASIIWNF